MTPGNPGGAKGSRAFTAAIREPRLRRENFGVLCEKWGKQIVL